MNPASTIAKLLDLIQHARASGSISNAETTEFETTLWYLASKADLYVDVDRIMTLRGQTSSDTPHRIPFPVHGPQDDLGEAFKNS